MQNYSYNGEYYTIPNNKRELKQITYKPTFIFYYTIPNNKRELKPISRHYANSLIIPYQTTKGN